MRISFLLLFLSMFSPAASAAVVSFDRGPLKLAVDQQGRLKRLYDAKAGIDYLHPDHASYLLQLKRYSEKDLKPPKTMRVVSRSDATTVVELVYDDETSLTLLLVQRPGWLHGEITGGKGVADIDAVRWGPYYTTITGAVGELFGVLHADKSTLGLMTLEPNTDGKCIEANGRIRLSAAMATSAYWLAYPQEGSYLLLDSIDHTRKRPIGPLRSSEPLPGATVVGSKVALYLAPKGHELDLIERIAKKEKLPYPTIDGQWVKRSKKALAPSVWSHYDEKTVAQVIDFCHDIGGDNICPFSHMFGNWGHFDLAPSLYPGGWEAIRRISATCTKYHIKNTMYTLTNFLKPMTIPEPFITPHVDPRFASYDTQSRLQDEIDARATQVRIEANTDLLKLLGSSGDSGVRHFLLLIDDELIWFSDANTAGNSITFAGCRRGCLMSSIGLHRRGAAVRLLYFAGYQNLFPGNYAMNHEVATIIGQRARQGGFSKVTLDGHESCLQTGLGAFAMNDTLKTIYELNQDREMLFTGSRLGAYAWHISSYMSWGEYDLHKGFRGSMLDYRVRRQIQLARSFMPHKLGQHYPTKATLEDINWLMGQAVGWDAGVEFHVNISQFNKNPDGKKIKAAVRKWEEARCSETVTSAQKLWLCQVDRVYDVTRKESGWELKLLERWTDPRCQIMAPSVIGLEDLSGRAAALPASIDLSWTHNPLIYRAAAISNDVPLVAGEMNRWQVTYPEAGAKASDINGNQLKFVLRVPNDSPCGIRNLLFSVDGTQHFMLPVELKPGQYLATPLNAPLAFIYDRHHQVVGRAPLRYSNSLPNLQNRTRFTVACSFKPTSSDHEPVVLLNLFYSETLTRP